MNYKEGVLKGLEKMLESSNIKFVIEYWDRETDKKTSYKFAIGNGK
jgi:hypothetical protein